MPPKRCNRCGNTNAIPVHATRAMDLADLHLCNNCWGKFIVDFRPEISHKQTRNMYRVIEEEDIPTE